jgi:thiamine pyrophosphokinase
MKQGACIFLNGDYAESEPILDLAACQYFVIGVDGGTSHIVSFGLTPHILIGDMDSLPESAINRYVSNGTQVMRYSPEKDETDFELALDQALQQGFREILVLGALGGRTDHMLANLLVPIEYLKKADIRLVRGTEEITYIHSKSTIHGKSGETLSLIPISGDVCGIETTGLRYALKSETLGFGKSRGVSNELAADTATISVESGILICIHIHCSNVISGKERKQ